jgi:hypothetical protein
MSWVMLLQLEGKIILKMEHNKILKNTMFAGKE